MSTSDIFALLSGIASVLTVLGTAIWWCLKRYLQRLHQRIRQLEQVKIKLTDREATTVSENVRLKTEKSHLEQEVREQQQELARLKDKLDAGANQARRNEERAEELEKDLHQRMEQHVEEVQTRDDKIRRLQGELTAEKDKLDNERERATQAEKDASRLNDQVSQVIKQDERVWERPVSASPSHPLSQRHVPIIAILNLKGGVGKTTVTANLAGLMARKGEKVLAIDADYQRNLSMLLVSDKDRKMLHLEKRTLQHFLSGPSHDLSSLLYTASEVTDLPGCSIITNSDALPSPPGVFSPARDNSSLEDVEMRLMAEWMFRPDGPDARLYLREALHDLKLQEHGYRHVLIDCPPRLSTACINALAASDFILIPVLLDATSAISVPNLLRSLGRLRKQSLFPRLKPLGVVANGVRMRLGKPIKQQAETWDELRGFCRAAWGSEVYLFKTMIPQSGRFADAAGELGYSESGHRLPLNDDEITGVFSEYLREIQTRIQHESKLTATVSA